MQLPQQGRVSLAGLGIPGQKSFRLGPDEAALLLGTQAPYLALFLQHQIGRIAVIAAQTKLFPAADTVYLIPQGLVPGIVKIQAADEVAPAGGVGIRGHDRRKPPAQAKHIEGADFVLPLMAILHGVSLLSLCWVQYRRPTLDQVKTGKKSAPAGWKGLGALLKN